MADPAREIAFYERACDLGLKDACARAARELIISRTPDPGGRRAEALFLRGESYYEVVEIRSTRVASLCSASLREGRDGCVAALRGYWEALVKAPNYTPEERLLQYGGSVRDACERISFEDCEKFKNVPHDEEVDPAALNHNSGYVDPGN